MAVSTVASGAWWFRAVVRFLSEVLCQWGVAHNTCEVQDIMHNIVIAAILILLLVQTRQAEESR